MLRFLKITAFIFTFSILGVFLFFQHFLSEHIVWGVKVNNTSVGGGTFGETEERLGVLAKRLENRTLYLTNENKRWSLEPSLIGVKANLTATVIKAFKIGKNGSFADRVREVYDSLNQGRKLTFEVNWDDRKLSRVLTTLSQEIHTSPQGTELELVGETVKTTQRSVEGRELLIKETKERIKSVLTKGGNEIEVAVMKKQPMLTDEMLMQFRRLDLIASFSTQFDYSQKDRNRNIKIAADSLKGYVIKPGETFSFNSVVGLRSEEEGYKKAMVIINNSFVPDWGGGVCQVSTTLYNTALLADMEIVERREHSRPVKYVLPGRGATVAYGLIDLRIRNPMAKPIIIWNKVGKDNLTIYFLGEKLSGKEVLIESVDYKEIVPNVITRQSNQMGAGQELVEEEGAGGYEVITLRVVSQDGKVLRRELIAKDRVEAIDRVVSVGVKETPLKSIETVAPFF